MFHLAPTPYPGSNARTEPGPWDAAGRGGTRGPGRRAPLAALGAHGQGRERLSE